MILRIPETLNYKYNPPRLVRLEEAAEQPFDCDTLLACIDAAHNRLCPPQAVPQAQHQAAANNRFVTRAVEESAYGPPDVAKLGSALKVLDPDCEEMVWKLYRIGPLAREARRHPGMAAELRALAISWSSGELRGIPSAKWRTPGSNGLTGAAAFDKVWSRFLRTPDTGSRPVTLGTIYRDASNARRSSAFNSPPIEPIQSDDSMSQPNGLRDVSQEEEEQMTDTNTSHISTALGPNPAATPCDFERTAVSSAIERAPVSIHALDHVRPLDSLSFPNPPSDSKRPPPMTIPNLGHLLTTYGIAARYNVIKKKLVITMPGHSGSPDNFDNVAYAHIVSLANLNGMNVGPLAGALDAIGDRHLCNPVADWIHSQPWDGRDRLDELYATLVQRKDYPQALKKTLMHRWLLSAAAAALKPIGFRTRGVLTLQGPQGIGKTAWTKSLVSDVALALQVVKLDHHMDPHNKDSLLTAITHWIVEVGELDSSLKKDVAKFKGFLTADQDKVRRPYAKVDSEYPRRTVFCATVNQEDFLVDSTGNTRFWTVPVVDINYDHGIDMQQVFAQLAVEYEQGVQWWLTKEEEAWLEERNKHHRAVSAIRERVLERLDLDRRDADDLKAMTASQVLRAIGIKDPTNPQCQQCGSVLREVLGDPKKNAQGMVWRVALTEPSLDWT